MRPTFHLVPVDAWETADRGGPYAPASLHTEGFIHCTDGAAELAATFDRHYATDPRSFLALTLDLDALDVPWRFDAPGSPYPHVYGPIPWAAVVEVRRIDRQPDGRFEAFSPA
jgi:uncharacterized protein (DUF952 family)